MVIEARALEVSEQQATDIESPGRANVVFPQKSKTPDKTAHCFNCGGSWPHDAKAAIPVKNTAIMRSIVEALKRVNLLGKVEHLEKETGSKDVETSSPRKPLTK